MTNTVSAKPTRRRNRRNQNKHIDIPVKFGANGGGGFTNLLQTLPNPAPGTKPTEVSSGLFRPQVHLFGEYALSRAWGLQLSLAYLGQGGSFREEIQGQKIASNFYSHYLGILSSFRWYPGSGRQFCIFFGPQFSYLLSLKTAGYINGNQQGNTVNVLQDPNDRQTVRRPDVGLTLGWDYEFDFNLIIGLRGTFGFLSMFKDPNVGTAAAQNVPKVTNIAACAYIGYNFAPLLM